MKKIVILIISVLTIFSKVKAYTNSFEYMASVMNIELKTENGLDLNEEIYKAYNQFAYGSPTMVSREQRWKDVADGKWTKNGGAWKGSGIRGEYWVLGYNYSNGYVHNHCFPADIEPPTPPTEWRYVTLSDAAESWNDSRLYLHEEQKTYMQTTKLTRNNITYDLNALDIGLTKAKVENYATWKTNGNIYTRRYDISNKEWAANFIVPPMAADAEIISMLNIINGDTYTIPKDEDSIIIPIEFGCEAIRLTDYAKPEHVKRIYSEVMIDNKKISQIDDEKNTMISGQTAVVINKNDYPNKATIELEVSCNSELITEFTIDDTLVDVKTQIIKIMIEGVEQENNIKNVKAENKNFTKDAIPPHIDKIDLGREKSGKDVELDIAKKTDTKFICAGQVLSIDVETSNTDYITIEFSGDVSITTLDDLTKKFEWDDPRARGINTRYSSLKNLQKIYSGRITITPYKVKDEKSYFYYKYVIPYKTKQTLHSWSTLREISRDAFQIDESKLFSRIRAPYYINIKAYSNEGVRTKRVELDVFERWDTLYNRDLSPYIK